MPDPGTGGLNPRVKNVLYVVRDLGTLGVALWGIYNEASGHGPERPTLLFTYMAMLGIPVALRADEARRRSRDERRDE